MSLPDSMKAVRIYGVGDYRLEETSIPMPGPGEVLIRVLATGICASDVKTYHGARVWGSDEIAPYIEVPVTAGHEFVGRVVALGTGAGDKHGLQVGDHAQLAILVPVVPTPVKARANGPLIGQLVGSQRAGERSRLPGDEGDAVRIEEVGGRRGFFVSEG